MKITNYIGGSRLRKLFVILLVCATFFAVGAFAETEQPTFAVDADLVSQILEAKDPLLLLEDSLREFFEENPNANIYFAAELNISNGNLGEHGRLPYGERFMFGKIVFANNVLDQGAEFCMDVVKEETLRLLFGPWHSKNARTYSTQKNLGWFPYHLDLNTGEWFKTDPRSPDLGIRIFHYTDYYGNNRTATLGFTVHWDTLKDGKYECSITIIRKTEWR